MDKKNEHIAELGKVIELEKLMSLSDNNYTYKDLNVLVFSLSNKSNYNTTFKKFDSIMNQDDLINCNNDLKLLTAHLFYYKPLINNPVEESMTYEGKFISTYYQTSGDWLFSTFVSCCYEKLYNFWDRIGDALAFYLNLKIKEHRVDFARAIDFMKTKGIYNGNKHFQWLLKFKENDFIEFNSNRKEIVHYYQFETTYKHLQIIKSGNLEEITKLWNWKRNLPDYFKKHLQNSCEGYYQTYKLINNLS